MRWLLMTLMLTGCAGAPRIVQVMPPMRPEPDAPPVMRVGGWDHQFRPDPMKDVDRVVNPEGQAKDVGAADDDPRKVAAEAIADSTDILQDGDCEGGVCKYLYSQTEIFELYGCYKEDLLVELADGEHFVQDERKVIAKGWRHGLTKGGDGKGHIVEIVVLRQVANHVGEQKAWFTTNVGTYHLHLEAADPGEKRCMVGLVFSHPDRELEQLVEADKASKAEAKKQSDAALGRVNLNYEITVAEGDPDWVPTGVARVMDGDKAETAIQFESSVAWDKVPAFSCDNGTCLYRYDNKQHAIIVPGSFNKGVLQLGSDETGYQRVVIRKRKDPQ